MHSDADGSGAQPALATAIFRHGTFLDYLVVTTMDLFEEVESFKYPGQIKAIPMRS
jgi:hypothetical protein